MNTSENCFPDKLIQGIFTIHFKKYQLTLVQKLLCNSQTCAKCFHLLETHEELESEFTHTNHICQILIGKGHPKTNFLKYNLWQNESKMMTFLRNAKLL